MSRPLIAVDICNTIADINRELEKYFNVKTDKKYEVEQATKEWFDENKWIYLVANPIEWSSEMLNVLAEVYDIVYLTARPESVFNETRRWLTRHGYPDGMLISSTNKAKTYKELGCCLAIDDSPKELDNYLANGCNVIAFRKPYNSQYADRLDWQGICRRYMRCSAVG